MRPSVVGRMTSTVHHLEGFELADDLTRGQARGTHLWRSSLRVIPCSAMGVSLRSLGYSLTLRIWQDCTVSPGGQRAGNRCRRPRGRG